MSLELTENGRKMHKEYGGCYISKEILLSDRWKKNKNFAANRKIVAIARSKGKSGVGSVHLGQVNNPGIIKNKGSSKIGKDLKLVGKEYGFESVSSISKLNSGEKLSLDSNMIDNFRNGSTQPEEIANSLLKVKNSTIPRMGSEKSGKKIELVRAKKKPAAILGQIEPSTGLSTTLSGLTYINADSLGVS